MVIEIQLFFHRISKVKHVSKQLFCLRQGDSVIYEAEELEQHVLSYFTDLYTSNINCFDNGLIEKFTPSLVISDDNRLFTSLPSFDEVKTIVFSLNKDSAPGPDCFGGGFYHAFWDIIGLDVYLSVLQFFQQG